MYLQFVKFSNVKLSILLYTAYKFSLNVRSIIQTMTLTVNIYEIKFISAGFFLPPGTEPQLHPRLENETIQKW